MVSQEVMEMFEIGLKGSAEKQDKVLNTHWYWKFLKVGIKIKEIFNKFNY